MANVAYMLGTPGQGYFVNGNVYQADPKNGSITNILPNDVVGLLAAGCTFGSKRVETYSPGAVKAASAAGIVSSVALSSGSLTIAAQPDVPRPLNVVVFPGTTAITAGQVLLTYADDQGGTTLDTLSVTTGASTNLTVSTSKGVASLTSAVVSGVTGGVSPGIEIGTTATFSLLADVGASGITVFKSTIDNAHDSTGTQSTTYPRFFTPGTAPNGTHTYTVGYSFFSP